MRGESPGMPPASRRAPDRAEGRSGAAVGAGRVQADVVTVAADDGSASSRACARENDACVVSHACVVSPLDALNSIQPVPSETLAGHWARAPRLPAPAASQPRLQRHAAAPTGVRRRPVDAAAIAEGDILLIAADYASAWGSTMPSGLQLDVSPSASACAVARELRSLPSTSGLENETRAMSPPPPPRMS
jgi:hypothetical protein